MHSLNPRLQGTGKLDDVATADWTDPTLPSWRHSIWVGVYDPWRVIRTLSPRIWVKVRVQRYRLHAGLCAVRFYISMHRAHSVISFLGREACHDEPQDSCASADCTGDRDTGADAQSV